MKTAVQQFMLGSVLKNEKSARQALEKIKDSGYDEIELCSFMTHPSNLTLRVITSLAGMPCENAGRLDWKKLTKEFSLSVIALHIDLNSLEKHLEKYITEAKEYNTKYIVITGMYAYDYSTAKSVESLAKRLNEIGKRLLENGLHLLYHNHNVELIFTDEGKRAYDVLIDETDENYVNFEYDSYWFAEGGADTIYWMRKLGSRMKLWHINDRGTRQNGKAITPILKSNAMELGHGNMPLNSLMEVAKNSECEAVILETHKNWINKSPIESLQISAKYLAKRAR